MRIADEVKLNAAGLKTNWNRIEAGGPGSGRHAMGGVLQKHGFNFVRSGKGIATHTALYSHPKLGSVGVNEDSGEWEHRGGEKGTGAGDLHEYLSYKNKISAGGPGSGRHPGGALMRDSARQLGFKLKTIRETPYGNGFNTQRIHEYQHPETGHNLRVSTGPLGRENFYSLKDKEGNVVEEGNLPRNEAEHTNAHESIHEAMSL